MTQYELVADHFSPRSHRDTDGTGSSLFKMLSQSCFAAMRVMLFGVSSLLQRPLAACLMTLCLWGGAHAMLTMSQQQKKHPAPLFSQQTAMQETYAAIPEQLFAASAPATVAAVAQPAPVAGVNMREVQQQLFRRGFYKGTIDGRTGPMTQAAILSFQESAGLKMDGVASPELLSALQSDKQDKAHYQSSNDPILIFSVQRRLNQLGYKAGIEDGTMSDSTRLAIAQFETQEKLEATGMITSALLKKLTSASAAR